MLDERSLRQIVARIVATAQPSRVILFGSYARGSADEGSDLDLMVVKPTIANLGEETLELYRAVGQTGVGVDLLLYSDAEFERRSQVPGTVLYWARKEGKSLYDATS
jgi:predicted nucleotidyltransferase